MYSFTKKTLTILVIIFAVLLGVAATTFVLSTRSGNSLDTALNPTPLVSLTPTPAPVRSTNIYLRLNERRGPDGNLTAEIILDSDAEIAAIDVELSYPTQDLVFVEVQDGDYFPNPLEIGSKADQEAGVVYVSTGSLTPQSGEAILARVIFESFVTTPSQTGIVKIINAVASSPDYDTVNILY